MKKQLLTIITSSLILLSFSINDFTEHEKVEVINSEPDTFLDRESLTEEEINLLFGEWEIKELIGFTSINDNESEFQNYPYGPNIIKSNIYIDSKTLEYDIKINNEKNIPNKYLSEIKNNFLLEEIFIKEIFSVEDYIQSKGTIGNFEMEEKYLPKENVKIVYGKTTDSNIYILEIFDDSRVIWKIFSSYFELEKVN